MFEIFLSQTMSASSLFGGHVEELAELGKVRKDRNEQTDTVYSVCLVCDTFFFFELRKYVMVFRMLSHLKTSSRLYQFVKDCNEDTYTLT